MSEYTVLDCTRSLCFCLHRPGEFHGTPWPRWRLAKRHTTRKYGVTRM